MFHRTNHQIHIPKNELRVSFSRSGGKGGQNVNKTSTKAIIHWSVGKSRVLSPEEKGRVRVKLNNRINFLDEVVISSEEQRSQPQNRATAISHLQALVIRALRVPKKRKATRPTRASRLKRLEHKILHSRKKTNRKIIME